MADPSIIDTDTLVETGKHVGIGLGSSGLTGAFMMWLRGREAREQAIKSEAIAVALGVLNTKLDNLTANISRFATSEKLEALEKRVAALESKKR